MIGLLFVLVFVTSTVAAISRQPDITCSNFKGVTDTKARRRSENLTNISRSRLYFFFVLCASYLHSLIQSVSGLVDLSSNNPLLLSSCDLASIKSKL
ncbi:hypothetical protein CPAR01_08036 [Colletotrichum paranaense]|uniref:Uncharacterized protein n=1 Tax=Colletotrichum paranaense TaxID=1914294 RepID=A0ABQ9SJ54_9PEZI|nr:uncharacterized protein CPAR01_08036 [Colletotrichum paranaense]KAK1537923.1 hypothetical protein CPAR01_08036 [Colletotrichum paranaense]